MVVINALIRHVQKNILSKWAPCHGIGAEVSVWDASVLYRMVVIGTITSSARVVI